MATAFHVYVDFDSTLYDTKRFMTDLRQVITTEFGVPAHELYDDYDTYRTLGSYNYAAHMAAHGLEPTRVWKVLDEFTHSDYLYDDSIKFIKKLRADGYNPSILSFGERRFQETKIRPTLATLTGNDLEAQNQHQRLDYGIVSRPKNEYIADVLPGERGVLVDNKANQQLPSGFTEIHLDRGRTLASPLRKTDIYTVSDLTQAYQVIQKLHRNI